MIVRLTISLVCVAATSAFAAPLDYPQRPVRVIVGGPAAGGADILARAVAQKLGLTAPAQAGDDELQADLFKLLAEVETDFTIFFRALARVPVESDPAATSDAALIEPLKPAFYDENAASAPAYVRTLAPWLRRYIARVRSDTAPAATRVERMNRVNPKYVLRNYMAQLAIDGLAQNDPSVMERMMRVLKKPYDEQPGNDDLAERRPEWARNRAGCSALS